MDVGDLTKQQLSQWLLKDATESEVQLLGQLLKGSISNPGSGGPLDGAWRLNNGNAATIANNQVKWKDGAVDQIEFVAALKVKGAVFSAKLEGNDKLHWSDGDIWKRDGSSTARSLNGISARSASAGSPPLNRRRTSILDNGPQRVDPSSLESVEEWLLRDPRTVLVRDHKPSDILQRELADYALALKEVPIVQFSSPMYYCGPEFEENLTIDVVRIGNLSARSEINFTTQGASAKAGDKFIETSGKIIFEAGSNNEELQIPLVKSLHFDTTTEFKVVIVEDPPAKNCQPGRYLHTARVKVIDGNTFPSNQFERVVKSRGTEQLPVVAAFKAYVSLNFANPVVKRGTYKWSLVNLTHSACLLLSLFVKVYLVDSVLEDPPDNAFYHLVFIALATVLPLALLHILDFQRNTFKVGGGSRTFLQTNMYRKFLNCDENARAEINCAELVMAMGEDVHEVVHSGYINVLALVGSLSDLAAVFIFQIGAPVAFGGEINKIGVVTLFFFPVLLLSFLHLRKGRTTRAITDAHTTKIDITKRVERTVTNYRLIADYGQRPFFEEWFANTVKKYNGRAVDAGKILTNNQYFPQWITTISLAMFIVYGGMALVNKSPGFTLGMFLADLGVISTIGSSYAGIYKVLMDIEHIHPAFEMIVNLINLPTDVPQRKLVNREKRTKSNILREDMRKAHRKGFPADNMPIVLKSLQYDYDFDTDSKAHAFDMKGTMNFYQGEFIALVGHQGEGKSTLLKMLGGVILPAPGALFVPSHLRILHVATEPIFFQGSLLDNLVFGCSAGDPDGSIERVIKICMCIGVPEDLLNLLKRGHDGPVHTWAQMISDSNKCLLGIARALIANPEFMCIHKPLKGLNEGTSLKVETALLDFCVEKGLAQDESTRHLRRPRTCIITAANVESVPSAHHIYFVSKRAGIRHVPRQLNPDSVAMKLENDISGSSQPDQIKFKIIQC